MFPCQEGERGAAQLALVQDRSGALARVQLAEGGTARWNRRPGSALGVNVGRKRLRDQELFDSDGSQPPTLPGTPPDFTWSQLDTISETVSWLVQFANPGTQMASLLLPSAHAVMDTGLPTVGISLAQRSRLPVCWHPAK